MFQLLHHPAAEVEQAKLIMYRNHFSRTFKDIFSNLQYVHVSCYSQRVILEWFKLDKLTDWNLIDWWQVSWIHWRSRNWRARCGGRHVGTALHFNRHIKTSIVRTFLDDTRDGGRGGGWWTCSIISFLGDMTTSAPGVEVAGGPTVGAVFTGTCDPFPIMYFNSAPGKGMWRVSY